MTAGVIILLQLYNENRMEREAKLYVTFYWEKS